MNRHLKKFNKNLEKQRKQAQKLYDEKQDTVVCKYCGKLLLKKEAGCVYDMVLGQMTFHHYKCFDENEKHGTYEDLVKRFGDIDG